jgi:multidrug efflux pump subunit AcrB
MPLKVHNKSLQYNMHKNASKSKGTRDRFFTSFLSLTILAMLCSLFVTLRLPFLALLLLGPKSCTEMHRTSNQQSTAKISRHSPKRPAATLVPMLVGQARS